MVAWKGTYSIENVREGNKIRRRDNGNHNAVIPAQLFSICSSTGDVL